MVATIDAVIETALCSNQKLCKYSGKSWISISVVKALFVFMFIVENSLKSWIRSRVLIAGIQI